jgi:hypothetical protein
MYISRLIRRAFTETKRVWNFDRIWLAVLAPVGAIAYRWSTGQFSDTRGTLRAAFISSAVAYCGTFLVNLVRAVTLLDKDQRQELQVKREDIANLQRALAESKRLIAAPSLLFDSSEEIVGRFRLW